LTDTTNQPKGPVVIKKYANRRLYNTQTSSYVTLDHLAEMVKQGVEFEVRDARTGEEITRSVLAQIIFEEENKGQHLLPIQFLRQLIRLYGDSLQAFVPSDLEMSMDNFSKNQDEMRQKFADTFGGRMGLKDFGVKELENVTRQNLAMFERAMRMFTPFGAPPAGQPEPRERPAAAERPRETAQRDEEIRELRDQLAAMRQQIADLAQKK
jgi:polyhydroxyalkanoate synthesis repressor PhaR